MGSSANVEQGFDGIGCKSWGFRFVQCAPRDDLALDNIAIVHVESICNVTYLFTVTIQKGASW